MRTVKVLVLFSALIMACVSNGAVIDTSSIEWTYTISRGKVILGGGNASHPAVPTSTTGDLTIPEKIDGRDVVEIGEYAFAGCDGLTSVIVPNSISRIGASAFTGCSSITNMVLPFVGSVRGNSGAEDAVFGYIFGAVEYDNGVLEKQYYGDGEDYAIKYCLPISLRSISICDETVLGYGAFYGCRNFSSIAINEGVVEIGPYAFRDCKSLTEISIPLSVRSVGTAAFRTSCVRAIIIPDGIFEIPSRAFQDCTNLMSVTISSSVTNLSDYAFQGCNSLTAIDIPSSVETIGTRAFYKCSKLTGISFNEGLKTIGVSSFEGCGLKSVALPEGLETIKENAFLLCHSLTNAVIPRSVTDIERWVFSYCNNLQSLTLPFVGSMRGNTGTPESMFGHLFGVSSYDGLVKVQQYYTESDSITCYIPSSLESVTITDETLIGYRAFWNCSMIKSIGIPETVTYVGTQAFKYCDALEEVHINSIEAWCGIQWATEASNPLFNARKLFLNGELVTCLEIPSSVEEIPDRAFYSDANCPTAGSGGSVIKKVILHEGLKRIGVNAFNAFERVGNITVPNSVTNIGYQAFGSCSSLTNMVLPFIGAARRNTQPTYTTEASFGWIFGRASYTGGVATEYNDGAGVAVTNYLPRTLASVTITDETLETGYSAFRNCVNLKRITLSEGMYRIRGATFQACSSLEEVNIPQSVKQLTGDNFVGCNSLARIAIPNGVNSFANNVFKNCSRLKAVIFEGNAPSSMGSNIFQGTASGCTAYVMPGSTGWNVTIPGKWQGINIDYLKSVEYDANGGVVAGGTQWLAKGDAVGELPTPTMAGYGFDGWYTQASGGSKISAATTVSANTTFYAHWTPNSYSIAYDANGGTGEMDATDCTYDQEGAVATSTFVRPGYEFIGWTTEAGGEVVYSAGQPVSNLSETPDGVVTLYAVWKLLPPSFTPESGTTFGASALTVSLASEAEGATIYYTIDGSDPTVESTVYRRFRITGKTTVKAIAVKDGESSEVAVAEYAPGRCVDPVFSLADGAEFAHSNQVLSIQWNNDGVLRYTLDGSEPTAESPVYEVPFAFNDSVVAKAKVFGDDYFDSAVVSVALTRVWENAATPVIDAAETFTGSKTKVVISCTTENAAVYYTLDGSEPTPESQIYSGPIYVTESCTVKARAILADYLDSAVAAQEIVKTWVIGDTMGKPDHEFTTDETGGLGWTRVEDPSAPNKEAMRSGEIANGQTSTLSTVLVGPGTLTFAWRTSCEDSGGYFDWDHVELVVDGTVIRKLDGVSDGWLSESVNIVGDGTHTVEWRYVKDNAESAGEDAAWVAGYGWASEYTATRTTAVPVPYSWLAAKNKDVVDEYGAYEAAAKLTGANGYKVWESYVIGADPNEKDDNLRITAFPMKADGAPDLENLGIAPEQSKWNVEGARPVVKGKASLGGSEEWQTVTDENKAEMRFFRVEVQLP